MDVDQRPRELSVLYRGPLSSCNYSCDYCPFAKRRETARELAADRAALEQFERWVEEQDGQLLLRVFFTPWGEALTRRWYREAIVRMSRWRHVLKVAAQTNLSASLEWIGQCDTDSVGLWCTFHPSQATLESFLQQCGRLDGIGVAYSVGIVGLRENWRQARALRARLPSGVYLWVNAFKSRGDYYSRQEAAAWERLDPLFPLNNRRHRSMGERCDTGQRVISVDGSGDVRRCHFVPARLGNLYRDSLETILAPRTCPNATCGCHIGYVHMPMLGMQAVFGDGLLERVPVEGLGINGN